MTKRLKDKVFLGSLARMLFLFSFMLCATYTYAQRQVTGTVVDVNDNPIIGASVQVRGASVGAVTDVDGHFLINNVKDGQSLIVSYVGFVSKTVTVKGSTPIAITLDEDNQNLNEVIVIGYGSVKKRDLTSAVSKMDNKGIQDRPLARAEQALQGQLAGVTVRTISGEPGADQQIRVRGAASVNASSDPLYVVDGVP